ncbi:hypothetical protein EDD85DRAFT_777546 [Armillaria nabsnona]|nr:hypothetical protein EDD85DRAFT_777546 [Armillaria nabsnona]
MPIQDGSEPLSYTNLHEHYHMSMSLSTQIYLGPWLQENHADLACTVSFWHLKDHILSCLIGLNTDTFTNTRHLNLIIIDNYVYSNQILCINFKGYDIQCNQDTINPHTHSNIMVLVSDLDNEHPYLYAQVIGIFHVKV